MTQFLIIALFLTIIGISACAGLAVVATQKTIREIEQYQFKEKKAHNPIEATK